MTNRTSTRPTPANLDVFDAWMNGEIASNRRTHLITDGKNIFSHGVRIGRTIRTTGAKLPLSMNQIAGAIGGERPQRINTLAEWGMLNVNIAILKHAQIAMELTSTSEDYD